MYVQYTNIAPSTYNHSPTDNITGWLTCKEYTIQYTTLNLWWCNPFFSLLYLIPTVHGLCTGIGFCKRKIRYRMLSTYTYIHIGNIVTGGEGCDREHHIQRWCVHFRYLVQEEQYWCQCWCGCKCAITVCVHVKKVGHIPWFMIVWCVIMQPSVMPSVRACLSANK